MRKVSSPRNQTSFDQPADRCQTSDQASTDEMPAAKKAIVPEKPRKSPMTAGKAIRPSKT